MTRQLASLLRTGMALVPALSALAEQYRFQDQGRLRYVQGRRNSMGDLLTQLHDQVNAGKSLSQALSEYPRVFSSVYISMVAAGEVGGTLEQTLTLLAQNLERRLHLVRKLKAAAAYPVIMSIVAIGVVVFLLAYVVPSITRIFAELNHTLPWPTLLLISISTFLRSYLAVLLVMLLLLLAGIQALLKTDKGKRIFDRFILRLPLFGTLLLKAEIARLTRTLGTLLAGGVHMIQALDVTLHVATNTVIKQAWDHMREAVRHGDPLAEAIRRSGVFPPIVRHVIATCQSGDSLEEGLLDVARMYDEQVETASKTMLSLLEPMILLVMGVVIGFIVTAILLPIFEINQTL
jgi:general secretion pathway protein F